MERTSETKPVTIVAIGAGNRTNKYLEYAIRNPDRLKLVGVAELNDIRRHAIASKFGLKPEECFADYERFFENPVPADAILIGTPENMHFEPCMKAIEAGYNVLLENRSRSRCPNAAASPKRRGAKGSSSASATSCDTIPISSRSRRSSTRASWERSYRSATSQPWGSTEPHTDSSAACGAARRSPTRC